MPAFRAQAGLFAGEPPYLIMKSALSAQKPPRRVMAVCLFAAFA
jgi:hypothetical protein